MSGMPRVMISLVTSRLDLFFQGVCHGSSFSWSCHFRCQILLPINSRIPLLPLTFLRVSSLTFVVLVPHLEVFPRL